MLRWRMVTATIGVGLLAAAGVVAWTPLRWAATVPAAAVAPGRSRAVVACASPVGHWTGHGYDRPARPDRLTAGTYEARVLAVEAGEDGCVLARDDREELLTILVLVGVVLLAGSVAHRRRRPAAALTA